MPLALERFEQSERAVLRIEQDRRPAHAAPLSRARATTARSARRGGSTRFLFRNGSSDDSANCYLEGTGEGPDAHDRSPRRATQMAISLGFHIVFAAIGDRDAAADGHRRVAVAPHAATPTYLDLARRWAKGTAVLFAVGAVSGTVLSFELGLLWPGFMELRRPDHRHAVLARGLRVLPEAIFLGIYLYGWDRVAPRAHLAAGVLVAVSGAAVRACSSSIVNAWMNAPVGFRLDATASCVDVDPLGGDAESGRVPAGAAHAARRVRRDRHRGRRHPRLLLLRDRRRASIGARSRSRCWSALPRRCSSRCPATCSARVVAQTSRSSSPRWRASSRPSAARRSASADGRTRRARDAVRDRDPVRALAARVPRSDAEVNGPATTFPRDDWPPVAVVHVAFQIMVGVGHARWPRVALWAVVVAVAPAGDWPTQRRLLRALALVAPLGFIAIEAGWIGHRGRAAAVGRPRPDADRRRRHADARPGRAVRRSSRCSTSGSPRSSSR